MKKMMLGNAAVARGLYEAGCVFVSSYPGTPSTEITEFAATYDEMYSEWAPNEKVAFEAALGACIAGGRAFTGMKHVGLNVAADPLFTSAYTGVNGGLVVAVADDMGMHSSQNEQDSRHYAIFSKVPMVEPANSQECVDFIKVAYDISEEYDTPVLLRLSTRISHSQSSVCQSEREQVELKEYKKDIAKFVMMPAMARKRHVFVEERMLKLQALAETDLVNKIEYNDKKIGVIAAGTAYNYAKEALGDKASYFKLGMVHPLPSAKIREFAKNVEKLYVIEELDDIIQTHVIKLGVECQGKELFSLLGEYTAADIRKKILRQDTPSNRAVESIPMRPPVLCPGCPHRGLFHVLKKMNLTVSGDIGCYTLGAGAPLNAMDTTICMGASISALHGMNIVRGQEFETKSVAVIGDSTFVHSGITGLIDIVYNQSASTVIIADNSITGMTGHQQNPTTGLTLKNKPAPVLDLEQLCKSIGVKRVSVIDPFDVKGLEALLKQELAATEPSVIITKRPCVLLKSVKRMPAYTVDADKCSGCMSCMRMGCPAVVAGDKKVAIDESLCVGCDLCTRMCPFGAIQPGKE